MFYLSDNINEQIEMTKDLSMQTFFKIQNDLDNSFLNLQF